MHALSEMVHGGVFPSACLQFWETLLFLFLSILTRFSFQITSHLVVQSSQHQSTRDLRVSEWSFTFTLFVNNQPEHNF